MNDLAHALHFGTAQSTSMDDNAVRMLATPQNMASLIRAMGRDKIIAGRDNLLGSGTIGVVLRTVSRCTKQTVPTAVTRIELFSDVLNHPACLQPVFQKAYNCAGDTFHVCIVPYAPDVEGAPITNDDVIRTLRVLKTSGKDTNVGDIKPSNFAFLAKTDGKLICYPADTDPEFAGKPIAFLRDLNAAFEGPDAEEKALIFGGGVEHALAKMGIPSLPPAPPECVEACKQQYTVMAQLAEDLKASGITPNVPLPEVSHSHLDKFRRPVLPADKRGDAAVMIR